MTLSERLRIARNGAGMTQKELAEAVGVSPSVIGDLERGKYKKSAYLITIAEKCGVNPLWLANGAEPMKGVGVEGAARRGEGAPSIHWDAGHCVYLPVLSWDEAGLPRDGGAREMVIVPQRGGAGSFVSRVSSDTMAPIFLEGDWVVVDPEGRPTPGCYVVARPAGVEQALLAQLVVDGGERYLKRTNERYPIMPLGKGTELVGVVVLRYSQY